MKKLSLILFSSLFLLACGTESAREAANRLVNEFYINDAPGQYLASETYREDNGQATVLSVTCNLKRSGAIPAVIFLTTTLEDRGGWKITRGPSQYRSELLGNSENIKKESQELLKRLPGACQEKYLEGMKSPKS